MIQKKMQSLGQQIDNEQAICIFSIVFSIFLYSTYARLKNPRPERIRPCRYCLRAENAWMGSH